MKQTRVPVWRSSRVLQLRYKLRMAFYAWRWRHREIASYPKGPTDEELVEYWTGPESPARPCI